MDVLRGAAVTWFTGLSDFFRCSFHFYFCIRLSLGFLSPLRCFNFSKSLFYSSQRNILRRKPILAYFSRVFFIHFNRFEITRGFKVAFVFNGWGYTQFASFFLFCARTYSWHPSYLRIGGVQLSSCSLFFIIF